MLALARWCSTHRRSVVVLWIVVLSGVGAAWQGVGSHYSSNFTLGNTGAQRAADLLKSRFAAQSGDVDQIVFKAKAGRRISKDGTIGFATVLFDLPTSFRRRRSRR